MWVVAKYNKGQESLFRQEISKRFKEIKFYKPKTKISFFKNKKILYKEKPLLSSYLLCFSKNFSNPGIINNISGLKGLSYFLRGENLYQNEISIFIKNCKLYEDHDGFIKQEFSDLSFSKIYKFNSGPFASLLFRLIEKNKKQITVSVGNKNIFLKKNVNYSYQLA